MLPWECHGPTKAASIIPEDHGVKPRELDITSNGPQSAHPATLETTSEPELASLANADTLEHGPASMLAHSGWKVEVRFK